jgi:hypothetical protein
MRSAGAPSKSTEFVYQMTPAQSGFSENKPVPKVEGDEGFSLSTF